MSQSNSSFTSQQQSQSVPIVVATPSNSDNLYTSQAPAVAAPAATSPTAKSRLKYSIFSIIFFAMAAAATCALIFPIWTVTRDGAPYYAEAKYFVFEVCTYSTVPKVDIKKCNTYTDQVQQSLGSQFTLCPQWNQWLTIVRALSIVSIVFFFVAGLFSVERICHCIPRLRQGILNYVPRIVLFLGFVMAMACMICELLLYTNLPSECVGTKPSSTDGAKIGGSSFLFLACWLPCMLLFIVDARWKDETTNDNNNTAMVVGTPMEYNALPADQKSVSRI